MTKTKARVIDKYKLSLKVSKILNGAVPQKMIYNVIGIIVEYIVDSCVSGNIFSVKNFGTIYLALARRGISKKNVKFCSHPVLDILIKEKKKGPVSK